MEFYKLTINYKKISIYDYFQKKKFLTSVPIITVGNHKLNQVKQIKYLGVLLDQRKSNTYALSYPKGAGHY